MNTYPKYRYPEPVKIENRQWPDRILTQPPVWASVDLRDGNQALARTDGPGSTSSEYFNMLVRHRLQGDRSGVSASASADDFDFVRMLIERESDP